MSIFDALRSSPRGGHKFRAALPVARLGIALLLAFTAVGCVTVKPQERTVLADPSMQFDQKGGARTKHALENREGSYGGDGVTGGGCGCN